MVHAQAGDHFEEPEHLLAFPPTEDHHRHRAQVHAVGGLEQEVGGDPVEFAHKHPDPGGPWGHVDAQQRLHGHRIGQFTKQRRGVVHSSHVGGTLEVGESLAGLLHTGVQVADHRLGAEYRLPFEFQHEAQNPVGRRVGRTHVEDHPLALVDVVCRVVTAAGYHRSVGLAHPQHRPVVASAHPRVAGAFLGGGGRPGGLPVSGVGH